MDPRPPLSTSVCYRDPVAAFDWLQRAFGLEPGIFVTTSDGRLAHAEVTHRGAPIGVGGGWTEHHASPIEIGGRNTQSVHLVLDEDIDAHCARARAGGARVLRELETQGYGDRTYAAMDLEGHVWSFAQAVKTVSPEEWDAAGGTITRKPPEKTHG